MLGVHSHNHKAVAERPHCLYRMSRGAYQTEWMLQLALEEPLRLPRGKQMDKVGPIKAALRDQQRAMRTLKRNKVFRELRAQSAGTTTPRHWRAAYSMCLAVPHHVSRSALRSRSLRPLMHAG